MKIKFIFYLSFVVLLQCAVSIQGDKEICSYVTISFLGTDTTKKELFLEKRIYEGKIDTAKKVILKCDTLLNELSTFLNWKNATNSKVIKNTSLSVYSGNSRIVLMDIAITCDHAFATIYRGRKIYYKYLPNDLFAYLKLMRNRASKKGGWIFL